MPLFIKMPVVIEAIQLTNDNVREIYEFVHGEVILDSTITSDKWDEFVDMVRAQGLRLKTLESDNQTQIADIGDYIIKGIKGEFYPCKPDIFLLTYNEDARVK